MEKKVLYIFRRPIGDAIDLVKKGIHPDDFYYGYFHVSRRYPVFSSDVQPSSLAQKAQYLADIFLSRIMDIGFSFLPVLHLLSSARSSTILFSTADSYGLPLALYKKMGLFNVPFIYNTVGLYDGLIKKNNRFAKLLCQKALSSVDLITAGGSFYECTLLSKYLSIPIEKFTFIPFGIDTQFFKPEVSKKSKDFILTIGADKSRDWDLFFATASQFPKENFHIITTRNTFSSSIPSNVTIEYDLSPQQVRSRIHQSKFIVILSKLNFHFGGQSTIFRCMSCAKAMIFTETPGVEEYGFENNQHCIMVKINDKQSLYKAITRLNGSSTIRNTMGIKARQIIVKKYSIELYAQRIGEVFTRFSKKVS